MRNPLVRIKELIPNLPGKDSQLANKFLENILKEVIIDTLGE